MLLAVNFHYIQPEGRYPYPGIYPTPADQLETQLIEPGRNFELISGEDLVRAVNEGRGLPERSCLISFDDALKEQFLTPGGKSLLFTKDGDGRGFTFHPPMTEYRSKFLDEGVLVERGGV